MVRVRGDKRRYAAQVAAARLVEHQGWRAVDTVNMKWETRPRLRCRSLGLPQQTIPRGVQLRRQAGRAAMIGMNF